MVNPAGKSANIPYTQRLILYIGKQKGVNEDNPVLVRCSKASLPRLAIVGLALAAVGVTACEFAATILSRKSPQRQEEPSSDQRVEGRKKKVRFAEDVVDRVIKLGQRFLDIAEGNANRYSPVDPQVEHYEADQLYLKKCEKWLQEDKQFVGTSVDLHGKILLDAARNGYLDSVRFLIENNADLNKKDSLDRLPIDLSIDHPTVFILIFDTMIEGKISIDEVKYLKLAIKHQQIGVVRHILEKFPESRKRADDLGDLLYFVKGNIGIFKLLLDSGAVVNKRDIHGDTLLHKAVRENNKDLATLILDVTKEDVDELETPYIDWQSRMGSENQYYSFKSPLQLAIEKNNLEMVTLLVERGASFEGGKGKGSNDKVKLGALDYAEEFEADAGIISFLKEASGR